MIEILKTCQAAMQIDRLKIEQNTHNIADLETPGFKRHVTETVMPNGFLMQPQLLHANVMVQGHLTETHRATDLAIGGNGFFTIKTPAGLAFTRRGDFTLNERGELTTYNGDLVLGQNGPINLPDLDIRIDAKGQIFHQNEHIDTLQLSYFEDPLALHSVGEGLYESQQSPLSTSDKPSQVHQGYIEASNVKSQDEMLALIETSRHFETTQRVLRSVDEMLSAAIKEMES